MFIVMVPVEEKKTEEYTVRIPFLEKSMKHTPLRYRIKKIITYRKVTKRCQSKQQKQSSVMVDTGDEAQKVSENSRCDPAGDPGVPETIYRRKWVPTSVTREVPATIWKCIIEEVPTSRMCRSIGLKNELAHIMFNVTVKKQKSVSPLLQKWFLKKNEIVSIETFREEKRTGTYCVTKMVPEKELNLPTSHILVGNTNS